MALVNYSSSEEEEKEREKDREKEMKTKKYNNNNKRVPQTNAPTLVSLKRKRANELESESENETETETEHSSHLPPLPSKFHDLYSSTTRVSTRDDPDLHGGRKRVIPHVEGNWPTHIYIEWYPSTKEYDLLTKVISNLKDRITSHVPVVNIHSFVTSDLGAPLPLHISLSRPIGFATHQKHAFVESLQRAVNSSGLRPFDVAFSGLDWVANFERTRWFLVLRVQASGSNSLNKLLHVTNGVVQQHGQPPLYTHSSAGQSTIKSGNKENVKLSRFSAKSDWSNMQDFSDAFHISIAWMLSSPDDVLLELTGSIMATHFKTIENIRVEVEEIKSKVGNVVKSMPLLRKKSESKGLFGI